MKTTCSNMETKSMYTQYITYIREEKNNYFTQYIDKLVVSHEHKYIMHVNHDDKLYGTNHYIYGLFLHLKQRYIHDDIKITI